VSLQNIGQVVLVGAGKMGLALARSWLANGLPAANLVLVNPRPAAAIKDFAAQTGALLVPNVEGILADVLVMAVKPQVMVPVMAEAKTAVGPHTLVISIAAGISIRALVAGLGTERVIRTMPNTPSQIGKGVTGAVPAVQVSATEKAVADALLKAAGHVVWFDDESRIDAITSVSGSGPAYVFYFVEALAAAAKNQGFNDEQAMLLARQTVIGAAALLDADPTPASILRENVTSRKGTTAEALAVLMADDGIAAIIDRAVQAARRRSEELGRG
jgi:pyrroline-5-carboxylate reductase